MVTRLWAVLGIVVPLALQILVFSVGGAKENCIMRLFIVWALP
jgi:hypothetical protein